MKIVVDGTAPSWAHDMARQIERGSKTGQLQTYSKAALPPARPPGQQIFVPDDVGGPTVAFSDGAVWRRTTDNAEVA